MNIQLLNSLWKYLSRRRKSQCKLLLILMFLASLSEIISIGSVLPFLSVLISPEYIFSHSFIKPLIQPLGISEPSHLVLPLTIVFVVAVLFAGAVRLLLLYVVTRLSYAIGADISIDIYRRTLYQEYEAHILRNSSEVVNGIITKTNTVIGGVINPVLVLISSVVLLVGVVSVLVFIDLKVTLVALIVFGFFYFGIIYYTKKRLKNNSQIIADQSTLMVKSIQEGLGGIRDVLIEGSQEFYCSIYRNADLPMRQASGSNIFISGSPKYVLESVGMSLIAIFAYTMTQQQESEMSTIIPILGALALGAQRLLPVLQQSYSSYSIIKGSEASLSDVLSFLNQPLSDFTENNKFETILFKKYIIVNNLSFRYTEESPWILRNVDLTLEKKGIFGFVGETGSGKSTLIDIIMSLLSPTVGNVSVDNQIITDKNKNAWRSHVAHVPQDIYISDSTIEANIAFGVPEYKVNHQKVKEAARRAQISELIEGWKEGYKTPVGECGIKLSGGQRQRIGIARALYKKSDVLVFDEATSALDNDTEDAVMKAIESLKGELTILIIAHRLSTLRKCNKIIKLTKSKGIEVVSHKDIISK
jgi:ATP-binding cassette, subfamily B, bacterial PglK